MRDIASAMGVSLTQVSFALRGSPRASKVLQERVQKVAAEMGYEADERMAALSRYCRNSGRKPTVQRLAWLNLWDEPEQLRHYREFDSYFQGASAIAGKLGFQLEEVFAKGQEPDELAAQLKEQGIRGILIAPCSSAEAYLLKFPVDEFSVVRFGLESEKPPLHSITADQLSNGKLAFRSLRAKGYRRIGFVSERWRKLPFGAGVFWEQKECPKSEQVPLLLFSSADENAQRRQLSAWIESERPDAVITDLTAIPSMLNEQGIRVPQDIALATTTLLDTPINAGINQHPQEIGRLALLTLVSLMNEQSSGASHIQNQTLVEGEWVDGDMVPSLVADGEESVSAMQGGVVNSVGSVSADLPETRVTQRDIAEALGISRMTVSLALRNDSRTAEKTRSRVRQKAEEMGYVPDPMLTAMGHYCRTSRETPVMAELAWLNLRDEPEKLYSYREFKQYWRGASEAAQRHGYRLEEFRARDMSMRRLDRILKTRNIRGILVPPSPLPGTDGLECFPWQEYAVVRLGVTCPVALPYSVGSDEVANSALALDCIREKGYERIAFVGDHAVQRTFGAGFYWAQRTLPVRVPDFFLPLKNPARHKEALEAWFRKEQPDAVITDNGELVELFSELGLRIPEDVALATMTMYDTPIDSGVDHNAQEIGRMGVVSLIAHMQDPSGSLHDIRSQVHVAGSWVDGTMMPRRP